MKIRTIPVLLAILLLAAALVSCATPVQPDPPDCSRYENTVSGLLTQVAAQATQIADQEEYISVLATQKSEAELAQVQVTSPEPQPTAIVQGSVVLEEGRCCVAGIAGQTVSIQAAFDAGSPAAEVIEMRVRTGNTPFSEEEMAEAEWQPFEAEQTYEYTVPVNWTGFYVSVQYRDADGNLSPVYNDDVSVEGQPPTLTPTP
jgi:hypothetical protein